METQASHFHKWWPSNNVLRSNALAAGHKEDRTSGYATMVHSRGCNPHRSTTTFANLEITSLWRHNSETI